MYDKQLIEKICNLTCSKKELEISTDSIKYDIESPFKKYFHVETVVNAIQKYLDKEWDETMIARWGNHYNWIICGGFEEHVIEELNSIEDFIKWNISDWLDSLSFFDAIKEEEKDIELDEEEMKLDGWEEVFRCLDNIFKTSTQWKGFYAKIGPRGEFNDDQFVLLVNDSTKQYMIFHSDFLDNGYEDEYLKYMTQEEHIKKVREVEQMGYQLISCQEEYYFDEINDNESVDELLKEINDQWE